MPQPAIAIQAARSFREVGRFIDLPARLHAGTPFVPPLKLERRTFLSRRLGPYAHRVDFELLCAYRGGELVGRISAHIDHGYNRHHGARWGWFGFFDAIDDQDVADALLAAAERWLAERGMERMVGPADFTMNDESGIVVEGNELAPIIREPWHPPYYQALIERAGLAKVVDLYMYDLPVSERENMHPALEEVAKAATSEHGITMRRMSRRGLRQDLDVFATIYNRAWRKNWGFVPYRPEDLDQYALELQLVFARDWFMVAEKDGEPVAIAITVPDVNRALARMNGRILPLGWLHYLRRRRYIERVRVGFLGVLPEHQHTGVAAALYVEHFDVCAADPRCTAGETGWILETNDAMNRGMEAMNGTVVKRYRMYKRLLEPGAEPQRLGAQPAA